MQGSPQDIEWCIDHGAISVVQSRPITTLYPLPQPAPVDGLLHVSFCVNHFQVMTDAMPPMALSIWRLMLPLGKRPGTGGESPWVQFAGGRLYADVSRVLRRPRYRDEPGSVLRTIASSLRGGEPGHHRAHHVLFEVFSQRYERGATLVTSNLPFDEWTKIFGSERLTGALLDRLTHHVHILEMNGESYRLNQSQKRRKSPKPPA